MSWSALKILPGLAFLFFKLLQIKNVVIMLQIALGENAVVLKICIMQLGIIIIVKRKQRRQS